LALLGPLIAMPLAAFGQPNLTAFNFTPTTINTASGPATVTVNFSATDSAAGIFYFETAFVDPTGVFFQRGSKLLVPSTSVTSSVTIPFPAFSNSGAWTVGGVFLLDTSGNTTFLTPDQLSGMGFPTVLQVNSTIDTTPPSLTSLSLSSSSLNTTSAPANLSVNFTATDPQAGVQTVQVSLLSPSGASSPTVTVTVPPTPTLTSAANFTFPKLSEAGTWTIQSVYIADAAGNTTILQTSDLMSSGFPTSFNVTSAKDTTPPTLVSLSFAPTAIDTKLGPAAVTVSFHATDDLSGVTTIQAGFVSPSGVNTAQASASFAANTNVTGTANAVFPMGSESGTWVLTSVFLSDAAGNTTTLATSDLAGRGIQTNLTVTNNGGPPMITPHVSPAPGVGGWNTTVPVTVTWTVVDPTGTGIISSSGCGTTTLTSNTTGTTLTCTASNIDGSASASVAVKIDTTPPVIVPTVTPTPNAAGWNTTNPTVTWSVTDPESGITSSNGCTSTTVTTETAGTTFTCSATNGAGLTASASVTVKLDKTAPTISGMPAAGCSLFPPNGKFTTVATVTASDALSGLLPGSFQVTGVSNEPPSDPPASDIIITPNGSGGFVVQLRADRLGTGNGRVYTLTGTAKDVAGNSTTVTATCTVPHDQGNGN
jgi:hypothetical protein